MQNTLHSREPAVYPFPMRAGLKVARQGFAVFVSCMAAACASSARQPQASPSTGSAEPPSADERAMSAATEDFNLGREAALAGDFACARDQFGRAITTVRPPGGGPVSPELQAFSFELYDGIQRYEALAGATEEAGTSHGEVTPELAAEIEAPEASPEAIATARQAVASDLPQARPDVPIVVNDPVLRVIAAFQGPALHDKIAAGLSRSGRYLPMIHQVFAEQGLPQDLARSRSSSRLSCPTPAPALGRTASGSSCPGPGGTTGSSRTESSTSAATRRRRRAPRRGIWPTCTRSSTTGTSRWRPTTRARARSLRAMDRTGARDFWQLARTNAIRRQTQNYVPAFLAAVLISKNPSHYGFDVVLEPPLEFETVFLERSVSLEDLSRAAALPMSDLQALNPELRSPVTPQQPEGYELKVPGGMRETMLLALAAVPTTRPPAFKTHVAKKGDTLPRDREALRRLGRLARLGQFA